jgi:hypothetical protein
LGHATVVIAVAEYLVERGADVNWIGWDHLTPLDVPNAPRRSTWSSGCAVGCQDGSQR